MFNFKRFSIDDSHCAMKVGTDGVVLGALASGSGQRMLDIGSGSGLIALMLAQRFPHAQVDAVELDPQAAAQANENFAASPFAQRLRCHHANINDFQATPYDLIASNPPFYDTVLEAPDAKRNQARHTTELTFEQLSAAVARLLAPNGIFWCIIPSECSAHLCKALSQNALFPQQRIAIRPNNRKPPRRFVIAFARSQTDIVESEITLMDSNGARSPQYSTLTTEFYL